MARAPQGADEKTIISDLLNRGGRNSADIEKLVTKVIEKMGGVDVLAQEYASLLTNSSTAPMARQRALADLMRLVTMVQEKFGKPLDLSTISTDDLEAMAGDILRKRHAAAQSTSRSGLNSSRPESAYTPSYEGGGGI